MVWATFGKDISIRHATFIAEHIFARQLIQIHISANAYVCSTIYTVVLVTWIMEEAEYITLQAAIVIIYTQVQLSVCT